MNADFDDDVLPMRVVVFGEVLKKRNILLSSVFWDNEENFVHADWSFLQERENVEAFAQTKKQRLDFNTHYNTSNIHIK